MPRHEATQNFGNTPETLPVGRDVALDRQLGYVGAAGYIDSSVGQLPSHAEDTPADVADIAVRDQITPDAVESDRKRLIEANTRALKKRFGETFVKGERVEGGYAGGGARELLAQFMEYDGFAGELKTLLPVKQQALSTLRDNQDYIIDHFTAHYANIAYNPALTTLSLAEGTETGNILSNHPNLEVIESRRPPRTSGGVR